MPRWSPWHSSKAASTQAHPCLSSSKPANRSEKEKIHLDLFIYQQQETPNEEHDFCSYY
jgi:hypothetical protein